MASIPRSGLFGFLLLLAALDPSSAGLATSVLGHGQGAAEGQALTGAPHDAAADSIEARLRRISEAIREQAPEGQSAAAADEKLAWVFANGGGVGWRNGGWGNGGFRNGGWGNGFRNGGWGNGGGWRNGGFLNRW